MSDVHAFKHSLSHKKQVLTHNHGIECRVPGTDRDLEAHLWRPSSTWHGLCWDSQSLHSKSHYPWPPGPSLWEATTKAATTRSSSWSRSLRDRGHTWNALYPLKTRLIFQSCLCDLFNIIIYILCKSLLTAFRFIMSEYSDALNQATENSWSAVRC